MDHDCNCAYKLADVPSSKMMNDFVSVVSSPPDEAIAAS
jgi:hypothetical protein